MYFFFFFEIVHRSRDKHENPLFTWDFYGFRHENQICANFQYDFRNQRVKVYKYTEF